MTYIALFILAALFAAFVWLVVQIVNAERHELVAALRIGAVAIAVIGIAGATALLRSFAH